MKKIKIAHVSHSVGGVDVYLRLITENLDTDKFENIVIHGKKDTLTPFFDSKSNKILNFKINIYRNISFLKDLKAVYQLYKILKTEKPNIIHAHSAKGGILGRLMGNLFGIKTFYTPNAFSYLSTENKVKRCIYLSIEKLFANKKSVLLATSNSELQRGLNEVGYLQNKIELFNNCIEPVAAIKDLTIIKSWPDNYICTVGRPSFQKNIELMVQVLNEVRKNYDIHLVIMGVGHHVGQLESVKKLIHNLNLKNHITLLDWTARTDIFNIISKSKLYISTARYEGMPYSIIESLALSKPCVVSDCDGNRDLIVDGYNGFVIKDKNIENFKEKILLLLDNQDLLEEFSKNAFKHFKENHDITLNIKKLEEIYLNHKNY